MKTYREMTDIERRQFESELIHAILNWHPSFKLAQDAINEAKRNGKFKNVKLGLEEVTKNSII
jgi:hypothetical protein